MVGYYHNNNDNISIIIVIILLSKCKMTGLFSSCIRISLLVLSDRDLAWCLLICFC